MTTHSCIVCGEPVPRRPDDTPPKYRLRKCCSRACRDVRRSVGARHGNRIKAGMQLDRRSPEVRYAERMAELTPSQREALNQFVQMIAFVDDECRRMRRIGLEPRYTDGVNEVLAIVGDHHSGGVPRVVMV